MSISASLGEIVAEAMKGIAELNSAQIERLEAHYRMLLTWNKRMNLTSVTELPEAAIRHYCESLFLGTHLSAGRVADIGAGAGFPGIPAAVLRTDCSFDLVESNQRKAVFLREASRGLQNVRVLGVRSETLQPEYDWVVSRAVNPPEILELGLASRAALLVGDDYAARIPASRVIALPWGSRRKLVIVSRETPGL